MDRLRRVIASPSWLLTCPSSVLTFDDLSIVNDFVKNPAFNIKVRELCPPDMFTAQGTDFKFKNVLILFFTIFVLPLIFFIISGVFAVTSFLTFWPQWKVVSHLPIYKVLLLHYAPLLAVSVLFDPYVY